MASVDKRPNGQWRARWREYPAGPQVTKTFTRKIDAEQHLVRVQHNLMSGAYVDPRKSRMSIEDFYKVWSERQPWRPATRAAVKSMFDRHVLPRFGPRPIGSVRRGDVEAWLAGLDLAPSTVRLLSQHLGSMFAGAVADGLLAVNPVEGAKRPRVTARPVVPLTAREVEALQAAAPGWFRVALTLGAGCGLRQGEATGLTLDRIDFLRREMTVDRQLLPIVAKGGQAELGAPKTDRSYRKVPLADVVVAALALHVKEHGTGRDGLVLHRDGLPVRRQAFGKEWRALRARAAAPAIAGGPLDPRIAAARFHDTRHSYASILLSGGVSVAAAAEYLGHSPGMLLATYAHLMPADNDRARSVVEAAFTADDLVARAAED